MLVMTSKLETLVLVSSGWMSKRLDTYCYRARSKKLLWETVFCHGIRFDIFFPALVSPIYFCPNILFAMCSVSAKFLKFEQLDQDPSISTEATGVSMDGTGQIGTYFYTAPEIEQGWPKIDEKVKICC